MYGMNERVQGDRYLIRTKTSEYDIVATELETTYDENQHCDYVQAFDQDGKVIAYFKDVEYWLLVDGRQKMLRYAMGDESLGIQEPVTGTRQQC